MQTEKKPICAAAAGWLAARAAGVLRPAYQPVFLAEGSEAAAAGLAESYRLAVAKGLSQAEVVVSTAATSVRDGLETEEIRANLRSVGERFAKAAASMDPDGLGTEIVELFCIGAPHMGNLDNRRRVVMVWSSIVAPSVVMREYAGQEITIDRLAALAQEWVALGYTADARAAYASKKTRFIARHPARIYDLVADTAAAHSIDHAQLIRSVIDPVVLSVGQYVGASGYCVGAQRQGAHA